MAAGPSAGELFVRVRPNTAGFKQEAEAGIAGTSIGFKKLGELAGITFGAAAIAGIVKEMASGAANIQKQQEAIGAEFGKAADGIEQFAKGAHTLGLSISQVDTAAGRFGLLFQNLGIGQGVAAGMTTNLLKLVGAVTQIRNIDPSTALSSISLALAGNVRSLKQLGLAIDPALIKQTALSHGWIVQGQTLTPTARALAIYQLAIAKLPQLLTQAQAHSGDLANRQRDLAATWSNVQDELGKGLIPLLTSLVSTILSGLNPAMEDLLKVTHVVGDGFRAVAGPANDLLKPLGGLKTAFEALLAAVVVNKLLGFVRGLSGVAGAAAEDAVVIDRQTAAFEALTGALNTFVGAAGRATGAEASLGAAGGRLNTARGFQTGRATRSAGVAGGGAAASEAAAVGSSVQRSLAPAQAEVGKLRGALRGIGSASVTSARTVTQAWLAPIKAVGSAGASTARSTASAFRSSFSSIGSLSRGVARSTAGAFTGLFSGLKAGAVSMAVGVKAAFIEAIPILLIAVAIQLIISHFKFLKDVAIAIFQTIIGGWKDLVTIIENLGKTLAYSLVTYLTSPLIAFLHLANSIAGFIPGLGGGIKHALNSAQDFVDKYTIDGVARSAKAVASAGTDLGHLFKKNFDKASVEGDPSKAKTGSKNGVVQGIQDNINNLKTSRAALEAQLKGIGSGASAAGAGAADQLANTGQQLADAIKQQAQDVRDAVSQAKQNLQTYAGTLADSVSTILNQPLQAAQERLQRLQDLTALANLRQSILLPGGKALSADPAKALKQLQDLARNATGAAKANIKDVLAQYQTASQAVHQDRVNSVVESTKRRLADLSEGLNTGKISLKTYTKDVRAVLRADGVNFKKVGAELGLAFNDGFKQQIKDLLAQAQAVSTAPRVSGTSAFAQSIVHPLQVLHTDQQKVADIQKQIGHEQLAQQKAIAKAAQTNAKHAAKSATLLAQIAAYDKQIRTAERRQATANSRKNPGNGNKTAAAFAGSVK